MEIVDAQIHVWLADRPSRPWVKRYREQNRSRLPHLMHAGQSMPAELALVEMAEAGVDAAVVTPLGVYGEDNSFELEASSRYPLKFAVVGWVDHLVPDVRERLEADVARGLVGVRLTRMRETERFDRGEFDAVLRACAELRLPVAVSVVQPLDPRLLRAFETYPSVSFLIDHLGVGLAPPIFNEGIEEPFRHLDSVLALARHPNVGIKLTSAPALSTEAYPFRDIWEPVRRIVDVFGPERVYWGSDFTRVAGYHSYWEAVHYLREMDAFDDDTLAELYGRALRRVLGWAR